MGVRQMWPFPVLLVLLMAGCATTGDLKGADLRGDLLQPVKEGVVSKVFGLAVEDAKTTLDWIDLQIKAGTMNEADAVLARACPKAVLSMAALKDKLLNPPAAPPGFKGVIYNLTTLRYGQGKQAMAGAKQAALAVIAACSDLAPDQLLLGF